MPDLNEPRAAAVQLVGRLQDGQSLAQGRAAFNAAALRVGPRTSRPMGPVTRFTAVGGLGQIGDFERSACSSPSCSWAER